MTIIEIRPHRWAGRFLKLRASSLCSRRNVRQSTTPRAAQAFAAVRFVFSTQLATSSATIAFNEADRKMWPLTNERVEGEAVKKFKGRRSTKRLVISFFSVSCRSILFKVSLYCRQAGISFQSSPDDFR